MMYKKYYLHCYEIYVLSGKKEDTPFNADDWRNGKEETLLKFTDRDLGYDHIDESIDVDEFWENLDRFVKAALGYLPDYEVV